MKKTGKYMQKLSIFLPRCLLRLLWLFPVKEERIFFTSYEGKQVSCSPKYLYLSLLKKYGFRLQYVWENNYYETSRKLPGNLIYVKHNTFKYVFFLMTSKVIITNSGITAKIPLRKGQIYINTWHGGGMFKKVGIDISASLQGINQFFLKTNNKQLTYFLSSSSGFSKVMQHAMNLEKKKIISTGLPRNDVLFTDTRELKDKICMSLNIDSSIRIILFAPTYRGRIGCDERQPVFLNFANLLKAVSERFGGRWQLLYRAHYYNQLQECYNGYLNCGINVSKYPDMQELLFITDILITDYSSSMWDYSLMYKPCFLFTPDLKEYQNERDFYLSISEWPYDYAETNEELIRLINNYDSAKGKEKIEKYHKKLKSCDDGHACERVVKIIEQELFGDIP